MTLRAAMPRLSQARPQHTIDLIWQKFENKMAAQRRKGQRPTEREMNMPWRKLSPRSRSPASPLVNGSAYSPHTPHKRESSASPVDQEYKKNVDFLRREWLKFETERSRKDTVTDLVIREPDIKDFQPIDVDVFLENLHQRQQQQQQQ